MSDCKLKVFDAVAAQADGRPMTFTDRLIRLRSYYTHAEDQFSERYGGISFSATMMDGCGGCRMKPIDFTKHPKRWKTVIIPMTDEEEDRAWKKACGMAGIPIWMLQGGYKEYYRHNGDCFYNTTAIKYDIVGMICHISKRNIWRPTPGKIWCSRACNEVIIAGKGEANVPFLLPRRAEMLPDEILDLCREGFE